MFRPIYSFALLGLVFAAGCADEHPTGLESTQDLIAPNPSASTAALRGDECRGTVGAISVEKIIVPDGASCILSGTRVQSDVEVKGNASVRLESGARVGGNIQAANSRQVIVLNAYVNGNIQTDNTTTVRVRGRTGVGGNIQLKQGGSIIVESATVNGDIQFEENDRRIQASLNRVGGNFQVFKNTGGVELVSNRIAENLQCKENRPAPTGRGNIAGSKEDQCARL